MVNSIILRASSITDGWALALPPLAVEDSIPMPRRQTLFALRPASRPRSATVTPSRCPVPAWPVTWPARCVLLLDTHRLATSGVSESSPKNFRQKSTIFRKSLQFLLPCCQAQPGGSGKGRYGLKTASRADRRDWPEGHETLTKLQPRGAMRPALPYVGRSLFTLKAGHRGMGGLKATGRQSGGSASS